MLHSDLAAKSKAHDVGLSSDSQMIYDDDELIMLKQPNKFKHLDVPITSHEQCVTMIVT